jgi:DNA-directed RNA polymerase specialized sigma24 family protein
MSDSSKKKSGAPRFEDYIYQINSEIFKRRNKWSLTALAWLDFDDVAQIIRIHIHKKWKLYDPRKPLVPWVNRIISNQIKNLIRNNYGNFARPCLKCAASEGADYCSIYVKQCSKCPLYAHWEKTKKWAHDTKLPVALENCTREVGNMICNQMDIEGASRRLHDKMQKVLKPNEWIIYKYLYIDHLEEDKVAKLMGYRTSEKNRQPGYKQIKNIKKSIILKAKKLLERGEVDIY